MVSIRTHQKTIEGRNVVRWATPRGSVLTVAATNPKFRSRGLIHHIKLFTFVDFDGRQNSQKEEALLGFDGQAFLFCPAVKKV
jgi:hypothetical protein